MHSCHWPRTRPLANSQENEARSWCFAGEVICYLLRYVYLISTSLTCFSVTVSVALECARVTQTGVFVGESRLVISLPFQSKKSKIKVVNSAVGVTLES